MTSPLKFVLTICLAIWIVSVAGLTAFAQGAIGLGTSKGTMSFQGTGTQVINVVWQNCNQGGCSMEGSATKEDQFKSVGTYRFSSTNARPFKLLASSAVGLFTIDQSSAVSFHFTSQQGTVEGSAHFTSLVQNPGSIAANLAGTLQVTGGTLASQFDSGPGILNLTLSLGKKNLSTLLNVTDEMSGGIDNLSSLTPPSPCREASTILSNVHGTPLPGGSIWFNASFSASGIDDGTFLHFQGGFLQFQANGNNYILHVPNAVITFLSSVHCASMSFDSDTNTWDTTVPISAKDEVFLSGVSFPVPASGLPGGLNLVNWSESFFSNRPSVSIQWKWSAVVFSSFSTDYNALGVKPAYRNACLYNNDGHAGTPEKFVNSAVRSAATQPLASWSDTAKATPNCP